MPILDSNGEIDEYISVRHDVTAIYDLQKEIEDTQREVVFTMGAIGETRSKETGNHVKRVAEYSRILAESVGLSEEKCNLLVDASPMHDIGKVAIPDSILHKPARLTDEEFVIMRNHAELGYKMLAHSNRPLLKIASVIAFEHHERWDGDGYPRHIKGEEISIEARITAIADVFDALGSNRVYKQAWEDQKIFDYFKEQRGKQFDPNLVDIFFENLNKFLEIREKFKDV
jgi:response regulator RpfG family c-di-GMP phosphodiesterase